MDFKAKIVEKTFVNYKKETVVYYDIKILIAGQEIKVVPIESDKKLLKYLLTK